MSLFPAPTAEAIHFDALRAASRGASSARSAAEVATAVVTPFLDSALLSAAILAIGTSPPTRHDVGDPAGVGLLAALLTASAADPGSPGGADARAATLPLPVQSAPQSRIHLLLREEAAGAADLLAPAADMMAMALDRLFLSERSTALREEADRRIREVSAIYDIGRAVDSVDIERLLQMITEQAAKLMGAQACSLMRTDPVDQRLTIAASYGLSEDVVFVSHRALGEGIAGIVAQTGDPLLISAGAPPDPRLAGISLRSDIGSSMVVPMKDDVGRVIGVLSIRRRRPSPEFEADDLRLFSVFASQAAYALNNKELYDKLDRRVRELSTLSDLTQAVISNLDLTRLLNEVADSIVEVVQLDRCCIFLYDRATRRFVPRILRGYRHDGIGRNAVRMGEGVVGLVAKRQMTIVEVDGRNAVQPMRGFARALGTNAFVAVPIVSNPVISRGQTIGVVVADNRTSGRPFRSETVDLLTTFVTQAGIAIENAQLHEEWQQRYHEINRLATQTDNILRSIGLAVVVVDPSGAVARWNRAAEQMWGMTERTATVLPHDELIARFGLPDEEQRALLDWMAHVRETGVPDQRYKVTLHPRRRTELVANIILSPLLDRQSERQGVILIMEDVTHEYRMEAEIGRIRRLADIGQLAAKMAHEVRNPLSSIKGAAQLMRKEYEEAAPVCEFLDIIIDEVNHLSKITTDLLDFARPLQLDLHTCDLNDLAERTLAFLATTLREGRVRVTFRPAQRLEPIRCDPKQIEQVMRNIIINAVQAMPEGGDLVVSVYADAGAQTATLCVCDSGVGLAPERTEEIFQPFTTTKTKGTGLGLPIVRRIVENHRGSIDVQSRPGEGACFSVTLPRDPGAREAMPGMPGMPALDRPDLAATLPDL